MEGPKYQQLFERLKADVVGGRYRRGQKMPSEAALIKRTGLSRITVSRALRELQLAGLAERIAGSGTFARGESGPDEKAYLFGLLIPELGQTEIFAPLCRAIAGAPAARAHALLWGNPGVGSIAKQALNLAQQFIERQVNGVFFAPLEYGADAEKINRRILRQLRKNSVATVLLDRRVSRLSSRDRADVTGIHHRHAASLATEHLLKGGCRRLCFVTAARTSSSITERVDGFRDVVHHHGLGEAAGTHFDLESSDAELQRWVRQAKPLGIVCVNDHVAGQVMHLMSTWGVHVPTDVRITGIDDLGYASLLPIPLTTVRQPIAQIGETALQLILERLRSPDRPTREVLLDGELIVRKSSQSEQTVDPIPRAEQPTRKEKTP